MYGDLGTSLPIFCRLLCYITCSGDTLFSAVCFHRQSLEIVCLHSLFSDWNSAAVAIPVCKGTCEFQPQRRHRLMNSVTVSTHRDGLHYPSNSDWAFPNSRPGIHLCYGDRGESSVTKLKGFRQGGWEILVQCTRGIQRGRWRGSSLTEVFVRCWKMGEDSLLFVVGISVPNAVFMVF